VIAALHPVERLIRHERAVAVWKHHRHERRMRERRLIESRPWRAVRSALGQLGTPYVWGGAAPGGFDCSGLVQWAYRQVGVFLPRTTWSQSSVGRYVSLAALRAGDLVFANGGEHVGLYIGGGRVVQAPYTGTVVQVTPISLFGAEYARRVA
jgi:peptidoglycan DL-endopeptidase CwlO